MTVFAFYGTFMRGQPGHANLAGAAFLGRARTAPQFRLYIVDEKWPALVPAAEGTEIECELYEADEELLARLAELEPPGWTRGPIELADGRVVEAFVGDTTLASRGEDVSRYGSWPGYASAVATQRTSPPAL